METDRFIAFENICGKVFTNEMFQITFWVIFFYMGVIFNMVWEVILNMCFPSKTSFVQTALGLCVLAGSCCFW